jgi:hypothetical protein
MSKFAVRISIGAEARNLLVRRGVNVITKNVSCLSVEDLVGFSTCFQLRSGYSVLPVYIIRKVSMCTVCMVWIMY